jgi:hypothetical protein
MLALKLRSRGYRVVILYDDRVLKHHDTLNKPDYSPSRPYYGWRMRFSQKWIKRIPFVGDMLRPYSDFVSSDVMSQVHDATDRGVTEGEGVKLSSYVNNSLVRYFVSVPDKDMLESEPDFDSVRKMFLANCLLSLAVCRGACEELRPSLMITSHGIYSTWGPFMKYVANQDVRVITYGCNIFTANGLDVAVNRIAAAKADDGYLDHFVDNLLDCAISKDKVIEEVDGYMNRRLAGSTKDTGRLRHRSSGPDHELIQRLAILKQEGKRVFAMFPNIMWDIATTFDEWNRVFDSPVKWLVETARFFAESPDKVLVIRVHPGEHTLTNVRKSVRDILEYYLGVEIFASPNILFVPSEERLNSYELFDYLSGGIVYNGTIGLELMHQGIPLIIGAQAAYSDKGFTYDIIGEKQYFETFDNTDEVFRVQNAGRERAKYFAYEYFFLHGVPVQFMSSSKFLSPNLEASPGRIWNDRKLDHIVKVIVGEEKYFQDHWMQSEV